MTDEITETLNRFRAEASSQDLPPDEVEEWIRVALPAVYLAEDGDGTPAALIGGDPMLPETAADPSEPFVASVDLGVIPPEATGLPLPADGHLLLFASPDVGIERTGPGAVLYVPAGTPMARRSVEQLPPAPFPTRQLRTFWHQLSPQMSESFADDRWDDPEDEESELAEKLADAWSRVGGHRPPWTLQLGGNPVGPQNDPVHWARDSAREEGGDPDADDWTLLASWRCSEDIGKDSAVVHWVAPRGDLASLRFDRVRRYTDMA
ncbi:hypothetical protein ADL27_05260 [Streptomyces sp. NRRL F-6602]|nr:hypothetical protein ADL27_05260 [Streptomyces sp. NRRL F-6602]